MLGGPAPPAAAQQPKPDVVVTVFSSGTGPDVVGAAYVDGTPAAEIQQDLENLARETGSPPPTLNTKRRRLMPGGEAKINGLANWSAGTVNLDPIVRTFRRFGLVEVMFFFNGDFHLRPVEGLQGEGVRVDVRPNGNNVMYLVWIDHRHGPIAANVSVAPPGGSRWKLVASIAAIAVVVAAGVFLIVSIVLQRRSHAAGDTS